MKLSVGSCFSGIGGLELGLEWTGGFETKWQIELDGYATRVLEKHWPNVKRYTDIRDVVRPEYVDLIAGGFPCQDVSLAGARAGLEGKRSGLWSEFKRIIFEVRPRYAIIENVPGLLSGREQVENLPHRCVCGWTYRRRGVHFHSELQGEVLPRRFGSGNDGKGSSDIDDATKRVWGKDTKCQTKNREMGGVVSLGPSCSKRSDGSQASHPISDSEKEASANLYRTSRNDVGHAKDQEKAGGRDDLDENDERTSGNDAIGSQGTQSQGADGGRKTGMVCPSCGRGVDDATTILFNSSWMGTILYDLALIGYDAEWGVLSAAGVGAPHLRRRVFIISHRNGPNGGIQQIRRTQCEGSSESGNDGSEESMENTRRELFPRSVKPGEDGLENRERDADKFERSSEVADTHNTGPQGRIGEVMPERAGQRVTGEGGPLPDPSCELLNGSGGAWNGRTELSNGYWWELEPNVGRVAHGVPSRVDRLRCLGNAVVPQVAQKIGEMILEAENGNNTR